MALTAFLDVHWQKRDEGSTPILAPLDVLDIMVSFWLGSGSWGWAALFYAGCLHFLGLVLVDVGREALLLWGVTGLSAFSYSV